MGEMVELQCLMCHNIWEGNIGSYCPVCYSKEGLTKTLMDATARIAALESALAERERECDRLRGELAGSDVNVRELWARAEAAESALAAARDDHRTWPTATSGCRAEPHMVSESELAALRSRADDEGPVERVARLLPALQWGEHSEMCDWEAKAEEDRDVWRYEARKLLAAADGEVK
jgi:hypothetical protein